MSYVADGKKQTFAGFNPSQKTIDAMARVATLVTDIGRTWGTGMLSGGAGNKAFRSTDPISGIITTEVHIDLTNLKQKGAAENDAIGLASGTAFIYKNEVANNGIIFKHELICTELPAAGSGTISTHINVAWNSSAGKQFDQAIGNTSEIDSGHLVAGQIVVDNTAAITANHYAYLIEGDTAASDGVFNAGQLIYRMYGYKVR